MSRCDAALKGAEQIGFTILSLTISLIAVLIPLLFMGDIVGRLFREFAITLERDDSGVRRGFADADADDVLAAVAPHAGIRSNGRSIARPSACSKASSLSTAARCNGF